MLNKITELFSLFKKLKILLSFRQRGREGERSRETSMRGCLSRAPYRGPGPQPMRGCLSHKPNWGPGPQPRYVP